MEHKQLKICILIKAHLKITCGKTKLFMPVTMKMHLASAATSSSYCDERWSSSCLWRRQYARPLLIRASATFLQDKHMYVRTFNTKNITCYIYTLSHLQACSVYTSILQWCSMKYQGDYNNNVSLHFIYNKSPKKISNPGAVFHPINETVKQQWPNGFFSCLLFIVTADYAISANRLLNFMWLRNLFLPKKRNYKCTWILFMWGI